MHLCPPLQYAVVSLLAVAGGLLISSGAVLTFTLDGEVNTWGEGQVLSFFQK